MSIDYRKLGRKGGLASAASNDMNAQAALARRNSPSSFAYWIAKQPADLDPVDRESRARAAMRLYFTRLGERSAAARRRASSNGRTP